MEKYCSSVCNDALLQSKVTLVVAKFSQDPVDPHQGFEISQFNEVSRDPLLRYHMARSADISQDLLILALICYIKSMKFNFKVFKIPDSIASIRF